MANRRASTSDHLKPHSVAKAELIREYLATYLNILEAAPGRRHVYVLDLLCGEGIYADDRKGTAVLIAETVKVHHYARKSRNLLTVVLNDLGRSKVEPSKLKVERVEEVVAPIVAPLPSYIQFEYSSIDAVDAARHWIRESGIGTGTPSAGSKGTKMLFVIDPAGYTQFEIRHVKRLVSLSGVEVFLFLPVPEMYRFVQKVAKGHPLYEIATWLWGGAVPTFESQTHFRAALVEQVGHQFGDDVFMTPAEFRKKENDHYVLIHATRSLLGAERMVDKLRKLYASGRGYTPEMGQGSLFEQSALAESLIEFIRASDQGRSNVEVAEFAVHRRMRVTEATQALKKAKSEGLVEVVDADTRAVKPGFYLSHKGRKDNSVLIRVREVRPDAGPSQANLFS